MGHPVQAIPFQTAALIWASLCGYQVCAGGSGTELSLAGSTWDREGAEGQWTGGTLPSSANSEGPEGSVRHEEWGAGSH